MNQVNMKDIIKEGHPSINRNKPGEPIGDVLGKAEEQEGRSLRYQQIVQRRRILGNIDKGKKGNIGED